MADDNGLKPGPQRQAVPNLLRYAAIMVVLAILIILWFAFRR